MQKTATMVVLSFLAANTYAQTTMQPWQEKEALLNHERAAYERLHDPTLASAASPEIDVTYYFLNLTVSTSPAANLLSGDVLIKAFNRSDSLSSIVLDLMKTMTVDSVTVGGSRTSFSQQPQTLTIALDRTYHRDEIIAVRVIYHGVPLATGFGSFYFSNHNGTPWVWSLSEPYGSRDWWPCKDHPHDKADSSDVWITCDSRFKAGSNGKLIAIIDNGNGTHTYRWSERYPIASYLISIAVTNYAEFTNWFRYTATDSMPVVNYVLPELLPYAQQSLLVAVDALGIFSNAYGLYPFIKEKYGHSSMGVGGAMEHQTMTSTTNFAEYTVAHELSHQWFGDMITCGSWVDLWLNEGFASYSEAVYAERKYGEPTYAGYMRHFMDGAKGAVGPLRNPDTASVPKLFAVTGVYDKGASVLHMLRHVVGDSVFFACLRAYASDPRLRYSTATTVDFQTDCERVTGSSLSFFFDEWMNGVGYPSYTYVWQSAKHESQWILSLHIDQANGAGGGTLFRMPLDVSIHGTGWDTAVVILNAQSSQDYTLNLSHRPVDVRLDPDNWVLADTKNLNDGTLPTTFRLYQNYPNPFNPGTTFSFDIPVRSNVSLVVYNVLGEEINRLFQGRAEAGHHEIPWNGTTTDGRIAPSGIYLCELATTSQRFAIKLVIVR